MKPEEIAKMAQIASALEVSGYPKPGNVHRTRDFDDMEFEDFVISGIVIGDTIREACTDVDVENPQLGKYILQAVAETDRWIKNNTNLGIVMMTTPIAVAAAISDSFDDIRENIKLVMGNTSVDDACDLYDAINIADAGGMGDQDEYDVASDNAKNELRENGQTMYDVLKISAPWDMLAREMTGDMPAVFEIGYPKYHELRQSKSQNDACVLTFLTILSHVPDTLISRKYGSDEAMKISLMTRDLLNIKDEPDFKDRLREFDDYLFKNKYNPGTTADLTAASIFVSYLKSNFE
ncbi:MAG: triphosphoribosyl-dephospho-CoA synthase [Methanobrevibacter sp.]|uniref:triphosphoribosyl-dephospho-CoA synthase n=1 Tax=Methanobrevibacter sp. UBA212 TaxID=1915476 RepID=UPI0026008AB5|nr:triphosphoribosyl-dephospho-CoA synthase [Methanobrevibacter sp. UBA212]MBR3156261.1 triphosphoribosyl-dephospho-CoA synthase [Methanobrevibacter sp.]MEE1150145.1 triphosphoribosyl-dephospho-CoA synthase [Methanobrevibacter sp.]